MIARFLGWLFLRSSGIKRLYLATVHSPNRCVRAAGFTLVALVLAGRSARQFCAPRPGTLAAAAAVVGLSCLLGPATAAAALPAAAVGWVAWRVSRQPGDGVGHRAGWEGYAGEHCENTIEGMRALVARDNRGEVPPGSFPFLEFDVQETKDGQLVVFHDGALTRAFPREGPNEAAIRQLESEGVDYDAASVQDVPADQLRSLHLGGRQGLRAPLLREFLSACIEAGIRRSLAVEVKLLVSDRGRQELLDSIRWYLDAYGPRLDASPWARQRYGPLGWAGVIAFPQYFALSFGEFGSQQWRHWARDFRQQGIPARACHFHDLTLIYGA